MNRSLRVVVAEDDGLTRLCFEEFIREMGHAVVASVKNGEELVRHARDLKPDLVVSDVEMPKLDGLKAARIICGEMALPFVLISGCNHRGEVAALESGCVLLYLEKPVSAEQLKAAIDTALMRFAQFNEIRHESANIEAAFRERQYVEQAKGHLMRRGRFSEREAFERIRESAVAEGMPLGLAARGLLTVEGKRTGEGG